MDIPLIEQVRIQAQVLVPLVKALQAELAKIGPTLSSERRSERSIASMVRSGGVIRGHGTLRRW